MSTNFTGTTGTGPSLDNYADGSIADRYKPQVGEVVYQKYGDQYATLYSIISSFAPRKAVGGPIIKHQERGWFSAPITVRNSTSAGSAGAPVQVTLASSDLGVNNTFFPQKWNTGPMKNGYSYIITAVDVTTPTAPVLTLQPVSSTGVIPAFAAGEKIAVTGFSAPEGSGQPSAYFQQDWEYQYALQIIKHSEAITGTAEMSEKWATTDSLGVSQKGYQYLKIRGEQYMLTMLSNEMLFSQGVETSITGNPLQYKMQGWLPWIKSNGGSVNPVAAGAFTLALFQGINDDLDAVNAGGKYITISGNTRQREIVAAASSQLSSNAMVFVKPDEAGSFQSRFADGMDDEGAKKAALGINLDIRTFSDGTRTYDFCNLKALSDPSTNNPTGYNSNLLSFIVPMNAVPRTKTSAPAPLVELCYLPQAKQKGFMDVWQGGANSEFGTNDVDNRYIYYKMSVGQRLAMPENWGVIYA